MYGLIAPSILAANHSSIGDALKQASNADWIHVDIMDNHFVPNLSFSSEMTKAVKKLGIAPVDTHLMIEEPEKWLSQYLEAGSDSITFHIEATKHAAQCIEIIKDAGAKVAIALKPRTDFKEILPYLETIDMVLVMTVEPGFGGQKFMEDQLEKVKNIRSEIDKRRLEIRLQVDGGVDKSNIEKAYLAGADFFVAGSSVFRADDPMQAIAELKGLVTE
ncbi:MAG: Ribulose-phosphate 3-epimerase [Actinomycetota bacterium]|jgi:ribulose-phosphate 3-epimerase